VKIAVALFGYAAVVGTGGPWLLRRGWVDRAPRLAVAAWQALTTTVIVAVILGGLALAVPTPLISVDLARLLEACVLALRTQYATPGGAVAASAGAILALNIALRCGYCATRELVRSRASAATTWTRSPCWPARTGGWAPWSSITGCRPRTVSPGGAVGSC
jgi:hypothetical protein